MGWGDDPYLVCCRSIPCIWFCLQFGAWWFFPKAEISIEDQLKHSVVGLFFWLCQIQQSCWDASPITWSSPQQISGLGVFQDYFNDAEATVVDSCQRAIDTLKSLGAEIVNIEIPHLRSLQVSHGLIVSAEISAILGETWQKLDVCSVYSLNKQARSLGGLMDSWFITRRSRRSFCTCTYIICLCWFEDYPPEV